MMKLTQLENGIAILSYGLCASLFILVFMRLLFLSGPHKGARQAVAHAVFFTALWAGANVLLFYLNSIRFLGLSLWMETLRNVFWFHCMLVILASVQPKALGLLNRWVWGGRLLLALGLILSAAMGWLQRYDIMSVFALVSLLFCVTMLVFTEQLIRNASQAQRWQVKFVGVACVLIYGFDFLLYSQSVLKGSIETSWLEARGAVTSLALPLVYLFVVRQARVPKVSMSLSHSAVFHTSVLLLASGYLILMALAGYYFKFVGGGWGDFFSIFIVASGSVGFLLLLFSGSIRAKVLVFVRRHFFPLQYDYRQEWLKVTRSLSEATALWPLTRKICTLLGDCVESAGGAIWVRNESGRFSLINNAAFTFPSVCSSQALSGLVQYFDTHDRIVVLPELHSDTALSNQLNLPDWFSAQGHGWLVIPLKAQKVLQGFVLLAKPRTQIALNWEIFDYLKVVASQAAVQLAVARASEQLASTQRFEAVHQMSAFFVHDMKTMVSQLSMMTKNAHRHLNNPEFIQDMLHTVDHAVKKMERILEHLKSAKLQRELAIVDLVVLLDQVMEKIQSDPKPEMKIALQEGSAQVQADASALISALVNLIVNAQEAVCSARLSQEPVPAEDSGVAHKALVSVLLTEYESAGPLSKSYLIKVADKGGGMSAEFLQEKLFKPFNSTKGLTGMGIGLYQSKASIEACGGEVFVESTLGEGTVISILLPAV